MRIGHLERREIRLRLLAPLFIGSGESLSKKEYIFDKGAGMVYMPDLGRLVLFLKKRGLMQEYEKFLIQADQKDFRLFLETHQIKKNDYPAFVSYGISAGEAAHSQHFREVLTFLKGPDGLPYIPGSSIKGALRSALAAKLLRNGGWNYHKNIIEREGDNFRGRRYYLEHENKKLEQSVFHRLELRDPSNPGTNISGPVNDFMRGIQISDSFPLEYKQLTLTGKYDRKPDGSFKLLPIYRECLIPGSEAHFILTLDLPVLEKAGLDLSFIEDTLHSFSDDYYVNFEQFFNELPEDASMGAKEGVDIILGGGAGYVSKTIVYNLFADRARALPLVSKIMSKQFHNHKHELDTEKYKASPHILKTTFYEGKYYQMGRCELVLD